MNDTEAEARRLLTAATQDMPPGIDLLGGFVAAQRRDRARRRRRGAVLSAGIAVAAASVTAVMLTIGSAPPALATVSTALTRTLTQSYHLTEQYNLYSVWHGQIRFRGHYTITSQADPARHLAAYSWSYGPLDREVGNYTYLYTPDPVDHPGRHWARIATASLHLLSPLPGINGLSTVTPQQTLAEIKTVAKVTVIGPVSGPGWTGTRYAFSGSRGARITFSGTVNVDRQGRARALFVTIREASAIDVLVSTQALTFSDFGAPVTVTPPPADQTFPFPMPVPSR